VRRLGLVCLRPAREEGQREIGACCLCSHNRCFIFVVLSAFSTQGWHWHAILLVLFGCKIRLRKLSRLGSLAVSRAAKTTDSTNRCNYYASGCVQFRNIWGKYSYSTFVVIWQNLSNYELIRLKRFISTFTDKLYN
jgi:hypothetical protein